MISWFMVPEMWCATDGQMDGQKKQHTMEVSASPNNNKKYICYTFFLIRTYFIGKWASKTQKP